MKNNKINDERVNSILHKNGYIVSLVLLIGLFLDIVIKVYLQIPIKQYLSTLVIFLIGLIIFFIKNLLAKIPLINISKLREKNTFVFNISCVSLGVITGIIFDLIAHASIKRIIFSSIFNFIWLYIMALAFEAITRKQEK